MKKLLLIVICMTTFITTAQITVTGIVKDSIGNPLEMANIIAINTETKKLDSYGFTDIKGQYKLDLKKNSSYDIKVSYIGMKTANIPIKTIEGDILKNISLKDDNTLDEVDITYKMPVTIKGDTIIYNADSFKNGTEKKLGDILKKLPGVEINDDGEIEIGGKVVKKVMIEGKDFFDGDSKLATKNIPSGVVDKIEVLKNHSEERQLSRVTDNEDNIVINIKLKEGKKSFWFGEVTAGIGLENRFIAHPKLFYYSPNYSLNIITDMNNIGEIPFTWRDYFKFSGGFKSLTGNGTGLNLSSDLGFLIMKNNRAKEINTKFSAANFSYSPEKKWSLSGFAIYSGTKTDIEETTERTYIHNTTTENTRSKTRQDNNLGLLKLSFDYKPNSNNNFNYDLFAKVSKLTESQDFFSSEAGSILERKEQTPFSINQNFNYYFTIDENHIFSFEAQHLWQDKNPFYSAELKKLSFANLLSLDTNQNGYDVSQNNRIKTNKFDTKLNYYYILNPKSNLNITFGSTLSNQQFNSDVFQLLDNGTQNNITNNLTINDVEYAFSDFYTGLHYKFITGLFTFNQGVTLHRYSAKNTQLGNVFGDNFIRLLPDASVKIHLKKSEILRLSYNTQINFTDVNKLAEGYVFNNYNRLYSGNRELESSLSHNILLNYSSFNMFNRTNVFAFINYVKRIDAIKRSTEFVGIDQVSTSVNSAFPDETVSANARFQKSFRKFKFSLGGNISYSKMNNLFTSPQDEVAKNKVSELFTQSYRTKLSSNFGDAPNFDIGYNFSINNYNQGIGSTKYFTHSPYINFEALFLNDFIFSTKYTYNNYQNQERTINNYSFWDAELIYQKKDSSWEYKVGLTNILNTKSLNQNNSVENIYNSTSSYIIQPRYAVFSVKYNL